VRAESGAAAQRSGDALDDVEVRWRAASPSWRTRSTGCPSGSRRSRATAPARRRRCCTGSTRRSGGCRRCSPPATSSCWPRCGPTGSRPLATARRRRSWRSRCAAPSTRLSSALVDEDARAARQRAALEAGLDRVRTQVTTELAGVRRDLAAQLATQTAAQTTSLGTRLEALTTGHRRDRDGAAGAAQRAAHDGHVAARAGGLGGRRGTAAAAGLQTLTASSEALRRDLDELGSGWCRRRASWSPSCAPRSTREAEHLRTSLDAVRTGFDTRAEELSAALSRGLLDIAEEVDVATTTTRDAASRITVLTELTEAQRAEVEGLLREVRADVVDAGQGLREELLARTSAMLGELGARLDDVEQRLSGVDGTVAGGTAAAERVAASLDALTATAERLDDAVGGFRTEWPTRTYEVVQGARAVAEGVVLDVRAEVGARLDDVRATLERVTGTVDLARAGLHDGTDRLAQAGAVLVAYLEHRDRLLEAERDRVLHEVLDAFAAGLSARERRRARRPRHRRRRPPARRRGRRALPRGARQPVSPTADLPDDVRALGERVPERQPEPEPEPVVWPDREPVQAAAPAPVPAAPAPVPSAPVRVAARPAVARRTTGGGAVVVPGPGRSAQPATRRGSRTVAAPPAAGRLGAMPEAPSVDAALDAASSREDDRP
jgi:hypothetical protein